MQPDKAQVVNKQGKPGTGAQRIYTLSQFYLVFALILFAVHYGLLPFGFVLNRKRSGKISF